MKGIKDVMPLCTDSGLTVIVRDRKGNSRDFIPIQNTIELGRKEKEAIQRDTNDTGGKNVGQ